jgi:hypothetical protein
MRLECLTPDFNGTSGLEGVATVARAGLDVYAHNIETVERLQRTVRDRRAGYSESIGVLEHARKVNPTVVTKSSIMLGLGEEAAEVRQTMRDLLDAGVEIFTLGQYLQPSRRHMKVVRMLPPEEYDAWREEGMAMGTLPPAPRACGASHPSLLPSVSTSPASWPLAARHPARRPTLHSHTLLVASPWVQASSTLPRGRLCDRATRLERCSWRRSSRSATRSARRLSGRLGAPRPGLQSGHPTTLRGARSGCSRPRDPQQPTVNEGLHQAAHHGIRVIPYICRSPRSIGVIQATGLIL